MKRYKQILVLAVAAVGLSACGGNSSGGAPFGSADKPAGGATPEETLQALIKEIADGDAEGACALFLPGGQTTFANEWEAPDCVSAMQVVIGQVTDKEGFAAATLKPSGEYPGVEIDGNSAEAGGACTAWKYDVESGLGPGKLGKITLAKTEDGWLINGTRRPNTSCGG